MARATVDSAATRTPPSLQPGPPAPVRAAAGGRRALPPDRQTRAYMYMRLQSRIGRAQTTLSELSEPSTSFGRSRRISRRMSDGTSSEGLTTICETHAQIPLAAKPAALRWI